VAFTDVESARADAPARKSLIVFIEFPPRNVPPPGLAAVPQRSGPTGVLTPFSIDYIGDENAAVQSIT